MSEENKDVQKEIKIEYNQEKSKETSPKEKQDDNKISLFGPMLIEISVGSILGLCAGYFCRQTLKSAMFVVGGAFIAFQGLSHLGYVNLNWKKLETDVTNSLDADKDGIITIKDFKIHYTRFKRYLAFRDFKRFMRYLAFRVPSVGSFGLFFWMGLSGRLIE